MISEAGTPKLGRTSAAFALAAAITIAFNTLLACVKDAYTPLKHLMTPPLAIATGQPRVSPT